MLNARGESSQQVLLRGFGEYNFFSGKFMNAKEYLRRIGIDESSLSASSENLKLLQKRHLLRIPFENLDIHWRRPIVLDAENFYRKIVEEKRGGFCYELNGLFYNLLREIGFQSRMISARVAAGENGFSAEYDHMAILTETEGEEYLGDVGFGSFSAEPLRFVLDLEQADANGVFTIKKYDENYFEVLKKDAGIWKSEYIFTTSGRDLSEFAAMCRFHQTSPESHFTRGKICSLMTEKGRRTLTDKKFIETGNGERKELSIDSEEQFNEILVREFQIKPVFGQM
ncbi:MAG TPA: arylamine N-acetyltransferase [Pyrinomonadaceae bacterium]|jgi:N-hydroxyarylamine O-acetyltransferase